MNPFSAVHSLERQKPLFICLFAMFLAQLTGHFSLKMYSNTLDIQTLDKSPY